MNALQQLQIVKAGPEMMEISLFMLSTSQKHLVVGPISGVFWKLLQPFLKLHSHVRSVWRLVLLFGNSTWMFSVVVPDLEFLST
jgi:hypothetical protein